MLPGSLKGVARGFSQCGHLFILFLPVSNSCRINISVRTCSNVLIFFRCGCGLLRSEHKGEFSENVGDWSSNMHTREMPTNAFGMVSFSGEQQDAVMGAEV